MADYWRPAPTEVPPIPIGAVLVFEATEVRTASTRLRLRVEAVRDDLSAYYADALWLEGTRLDATGSPTGRMQALVETTAISAAIERGRHGPGCHAGD